MGAVMTAFNGMNEGLTPPSDNHSGDQVSIQQAPKQYHWKHLPRTNMRALLWVCALITSSLALWPQPKHFEHGSSTLWLSANVQLVHSSHSASTQPLGWLWTTVQQVIR